MCYSVFEACPYKGLSKVCPQIAQWLVSKRFFLILLPVKVFCTSNKRQILKILWNFEWNAIHKDFSKDKSAYILSLTHLNEIASLHIHSKGFLREIITLYPLTHTFKWTRALTHTFKKHNIHSQSINTPSAGTSTELNSLLNQNKFCFLMKTDNTKKTLFLVNKQI